jgi:hypothetical protein
MAEEWLTYAELGERLGVSPEAARQKAIRARWQRRMTNDGKRQILVDVEDVMVATPPRKPREVADDRPTPEAHPSDAQTIAALDAHIVTLKDMVAKVESLADLERKRADEERLRADAERARADAERSRANTLAARVEELLGDRVKAEELQGEVANLEQQVRDLRLVVEAAARRSWWRRLAGRPGVGHLSNSQTLRTV